MPLVRCDYDGNLIERTVLDELVEHILQESCRIFTVKPEAMSVFTKPFEQSDYSSVAVEIEVRAKISEFDHATLSRDQVRQNYLNDYKGKLEVFIKKHNIAKGIVCTITFEDWQVVWLPGLVER